MGQPFRSPKSFLQPIRRDRMARQHSHTRVENPWLGILQLWIQYVQHTAKHQPKNLAKRLNRQNLEKSTNTVTSLISTSYLLEQRLWGLLAHMLFNALKIWGTKLAKSMVNVAPNLFSSNQ